MKIAVCVQSGYPLGKIRHWVATLPPTATILLHGCATSLDDLSAEENIIHQVARARALPVLFQNGDHKEPWFHRAEGLVILRDGHGHPMKEERIALEHGIAIAVKPARVW